MKPGIIVQTVFLLFSFSCLAEGTKQLRPDSVYQCEVWVQDGSPFGYTCFATDACGPDQSLFIHIAHPGEKVYMGFNETLGSTVSFRIKLNGVTEDNGSVPSLITAPGFIQFYSQALAGPDVLNPQGYHAITFTPATAGDYNIVFDLPSSGNLYLRLVDITVIDTTKTPLMPIDGRVWSKDWSIESDNPCQATLCILASDSVVSSINLNNMIGLNFDVTSTRNGCIPPPEPFDSACRSRHGNHHYAEYKLFLNDPDSVEYPTGFLGSILGDTVHVVRGCNGSFTFQFTVDKTGTIKLNIETNLAPGMQPEDLTITHDVLPGLNTLFWNGLNGLGDPVPCGDSVEISIDYLNGLTNLALYDVEGNGKGFIIQPVRPMGQPVATYWNDTLLASLGGQLQLTGCYYIPPDTGCHTWLEGAGSMGDGNTVNTWWYAVSDFLDLGRYAVACVPHTPQGIFGPDTLCESSTGIYTCDPDPLIGTDREGYEWVLTDAGSGTILFDSVDTGPSVNIHFSAYPPGQKWLKVRGHSKDCGLGAFGPGTNGEGILINLVPATEIINNIKSFTICSGDTINILLESSMAGTAFSYTANASAQTTTGYSSGVQNPIVQTLVNSGTHADTVFYHVVPFLNPCQGDTTIFKVIVNPFDTMNFLISASANPVCSGTIDTFSVTTPIGGSSASYQWYVNGIASGTDAPLFIYAPVNGDTVMCTIHSSEFCTPGKIATSQPIIMIITSPATVSVSASASVNPVCKGDPVKITAVTINGGSNPSYQWKVNGASAGTDTSYYTYIPADGDRVICIMISDQPCVLNDQASDTLQIFVNELLKVVDTNICYGTPYYAQGAWQTTAGTYHDTLAIPVQCIRFIETNLSYKPPVVVDLGKDTSICEGMISLSVHIPGATFLWQDGSTDSVYIVSHSGKYRLQVTYEGCAGSDSINIRDCPSELWFPNAFTPNGDGVNDTFHPIGKGIEKFSIRIFNRWGEMIFESSVPEPGWDGRFKGKACPEGTYVFEAFFENSNGQSQHVTGTVTLLRPE